LRFDAYGEGAAAQDDLLTPARGAAGSHLVVDVEPRTAAPRRRLRSSFRAYSSRNDILSVGLIQYFDHLPEVDEIGSLGVTLPVADYRFNTAEVEGISDPGRTFSGAARYQIGDFYGGTQRSLELRGAFRTFGRLIWELRYERGRFTFPESIHPGGRVRANLIGNRIIWAFTPDLSVKLFTQWNDTENRIGTNVLVRYTYQPGSELFFVYNETYDTFGRGTDIENRSAAIKIAHRL